MKRAMSDGAGVHRSLDLPGLIIPNTQEMPA